MPIKIIAHRGNSAEAPENTKAAFLEAIHSKVDFLECDIQMSLDGIPIVNHDGDFKRITNHRFAYPVNTVNFLEMQKIDIGSWFDEKYASEKTLSLKEFLDLTQDKVHIMLDLKSETIQTKEHVLNIAEVINEHLRKNPTSNIFVGSLDLQILLNIKENLSEDLLLPIIESEEQIIEFESLAAKIYAIDDAVITEKIIQDLHAKQIKVWVWVVDDAQRAKTLISQGIDGIITNTPKVINHLLSCHIEHN